MLSSERDIEAGFILAREGLELSEMVLTPPKVTWLWRQMNRHRTLFSDLTRGSVENFVALVQMPHSYWMEVTRNGEIIGVIYVEQLNLVTDCEAHVAFFDRKLADKVTLAQAALQHVFDKFGVHRITVRMPKMYWTTVRFAKNVGFQYEGTRRQVYLIGGHWQDEVILGILNGEVPDGRFD
jgi:RimJ/RimL family protein N-acetyltransferase